MILQGQIKFRPPLNNATLNGINNNFNSDHWKLYNNRIECISPWVWVSNDVNVGQLKILITQLKGRKLRFSGQFLALKGDPNKYTKWKYYIKNGEVHNESAVFNFVKVYKPRPNRVAHAYTGPKNRTTPAPPPQPPARPHTPPPPTIRPPTPPLDIFTLINYDNIKGDKLYDEEIDPYLTLLKLHGKLVPKLGKILILPAEVFNIIYVPPKKSKYIPKKVREEFAAYVRYPNKTEKERFKICMEIDQLRNKTFKDFDYVILPVSIEDHWILFDFDIKRQEMGIYDSIHKMYQDITKIFNNFLIYQGFKKRFKVIYWNTPKQNDKTSCGVFILEYARSLLHEGDFKFSQKDIPNIRKRMERELKNRKLESGFKYLP